MLFLLGTYVSTLMYKCLTIFVELDKTIKVVDEDAFTLEVLNKLMEFIKRYRAKSSVSRHSCAIKEHFVGLPGAKKNKGKTWWKYAILRMDNRTKVVNGKLLKREVKIYNAFDITEEAI